MATKPETKSNRIELHVTEATYNEIASAMNASGQQLQPGAEIVLSKDITIKNPLDLRLMQVRTQAAEIAAKVCDCDSSTFLDLMEEITEYIVHGKKLEQKIGQEPEKTASKGWGKSNATT